MTLVGPSKPTSGKPRASEKLLQAAVMKRLRAPVGEGWGAAAYHPVGSAAAKGGEPDCVGSVPIPAFGGLGRHFAIELKQPGKKPTPLQAKRLRDYAAAGSLAGWATTEAEVDELMSHADDPSWVNPQIAELQLR